MGEKKMVKGVKGSSLDGGSVDKPKKIPPIEKPKSGTAVESVSSAAVAEKSTSKANPAVSILKEECAVLKEGYLDYFKSLPSEIVDVTKIVIAGVSKFVREEPKKAAIGVCVVVVCLVTFITCMALLVGVEMEPRNKVVNTLIYPSNGTVVLDAGDYYIASSDTDLLYMLTKVSSTGENVVVGRSFDGNNWESLSSESMDFDCNILDGFCTVTIPSASDKTYYQIESVSTKTFSMDSTSIAATFLMQATFGQTRETISNFLNDHGGDFSSWITAQMNEPMWMHRAYYRKRTNTRLDVATIVGGVRMPCDSKSRWHRFAFTDADVGKTVVVTQLSPNIYSFSVDGITITDDISADVYNATLHGWSFDVCEVEEFRGGDVTVGSSCDIEFGNPLIVINHLQEAFTLINSTSYTNFTELADVPDIFLFTGQSTDMTTCFASIGTPLYAATAYGVLKYDPRVVTLDNTVENPIDFSTSSQQECPVVAKTFLNIDGCIADRETCSPILYSPAFFTLNETMIRYFYSIAGRYVYYVSGLRPEDDDISSPCAGETSRWVYRKNETDAYTCDTTFTNQTVKSMIVHALTAAGTNTGNGRVREISVLCEDTSDSLVGARVLVGTECWEHAHPEEYSVYDFSLWTRAHPGGAYYIEQSAIEGSPKINFPSWHAMSRWNTGERDLILLGNLGEEVNFANLATEVQQVDFATLVGAVGARSADGFEVCGSPGEVSNDPSLGNMYRFMVGDETNVFTQVLDQAEDPSSVFQKSTLWNSVTFKATDQLRQKVAWALSQIFVINQDGTNLAQNTEVYAVYYDIFVRHAFGNYRDIMREVSYSPMMARMLTYYQNRGFESTGQYPDENYAREVMQLFSIGLYELHQNGTHKRDAQGNSIATYTNDDILSFARAWTGFTNQATRGNFEARYYENYENFIDPMTLRSSWRDAHPKKDLFDGFIGDGFPLCSSRPSTQFLKKGAVFRYRGQNPLPELIEDPSDYGNDKDTDVVRFNLNKSTSQLYAFLCNGTTTISHPDSSKNENCNFKSQVILDQNLVCDGMECDVDTVRMVRMNYTNNGTIVPVYYEYVQSACANLAFYENATTVSGRGGSNWNSGHMCANKAALEGQASCCSSSSLYANSACAYYGERLSFFSAQERCESLGLELCKFRSTTRDDCFDNVYLWSNFNCSTNVQIDATGLVSIVHDSELEWDSRMPLNSGMYIQVTWENNSYPSVDGTGCYGCRTVGETCYCSTEVEESAVFSTTLPSAEEVKAYLHIGAFDVETYVDDEAFTECSVLSTSNVTVHIPPGSASSCSASGFYLDKDVVFEIKNQLGNSEFYLNMESLVKLGFGQYSFRNAPTLMSLRERTIRDAQHEIEAVLDHYMSHPNVPPFVAYRMIQRFVSSNPSPRYVEVVADAFKYGVYGEFGTGVRGDMAATIAAVLLDREARSTTLLHDPTHGQIREPLVKLIHVLRAMEYKHSELHTELDIRTEDSFGQMPFRAPNVFNYFLPDYQPAGPMAEAGLVSPEAQLLTAPYIVNFINGLISLFKWGLNDCYQGFASLKGNGCGLTTVQKYDHTDWAGNLTYQPSDSLTTTQEIIAEMDVLFTGGRMNEDGLSAIAYAYDNALENGGSRFDAVQAAQQLFIMTPEFHTTNANKPTDIDRTATGNETVVSNPDDYKAIVFIYFAGAIDSFNLLVPYSDCNASDLYAEYVQVRENVALSLSDLLPIEVPNGTQPCNTFGVHHSLEIVQELYEEGDAAWVANVGPLVEPITKQEYEDKTKEVPPSLFSHNKQQLATLTVHAEDLNYAKGVIGRTMDALTDEGYVTGSYSIAGNVKVLEPVTSSSYDVIDRNSGVTTLDSSDTSSEILALMKNLTKPVSKSVYGETWKQQLWAAMERTESLDAALDGVSLESGWNPSSNLGRQLEQVALLVKANQEVIHNERDAFYVEIGGFDTHADLYEVLEGKMDEVNDALTNFIAEMKLQNMWGNVTIIATSEFGRTLTSNGLGTDHAWGGNTFILSGSLCGGQIFGQYPSDLTADGAQNIGRGRLIPTTSWEAVWNAISGWFGVDEDKMTTVLPHLENFGDDIILPSEMYSDENGCVADPTPKKKNSRSEEEVWTETNVALVATSSVLFFFIVIAVAVLAYFRYVLKQPFDTIPGYLFIASCLVAVKVGISKCFAPKENEGETEVDPNLKKRTETESPKYKGSGLKSIKGVSRVSPQKNAESETPTKRVPLRLFSLDRGVGKEKSNTPSKSAGKGKDMSL